MKTLMIDDHEINIDPLCEQMTVETFETIVNKPATLEELSAGNLAQAVLNHPHSLLIFKRLLNEYLTLTPQKVEDVINEVITHHGKFDMNQSVLLDLLEKV